MRASSWHRVTTQAIVLTTSIALVVTPPTTSGAPTGAGPSASPAVSIATVTTRDFRVAVVATRASGGAAPTADVRLEVAHRVGTSWRERGEIRLRGPHFWQTVTGPRSICRLEIATAGSRTSFRPQVTVQLLRSPSLGCGPTRRLTLD